MIVSWQQSYWVRATLLISLLITAWSGPVWTALIIGIFYVLVYRGFEVLLVAFVVDAFYGYGSSYPYLYTVGTFVVLCASRLIETYVQVYNRI